MQPPKLFCSPNQGNSLTKDYEVTAKLPDPVAQGMAIDFLVGNESTKVLAASTVLKDRDGAKENLGIIVNYEIEIRILINGVGDQVVSVPILLL